MLLLSLLLSGNKKALPKTFESAYFPGAGKGVRTLDTRLGKPVLYH
jgi:hypothetical protein